MQSEELWMNAVFLEKFLYYCYMLGKVTHTSDRIEYPDFSPLVNSNVKCHPGCLLKNHPDFSPLVSTFINASFTLFYLGYQCVCYTDNSVHHAISLEIFV